jgi:hypothetical protein
VLCEVLVELPCGHVFHRTCLEGVVRAGQARCPGPDRNFIPQAVLDRLGGGGEGAVEGREARLGPYDPNAGDFYQNDASIPADEADERVYNTYDDYDEVDEDVDDWMSRFEQYVQREQDSADAGALNVVQRRVADIHSEFTSEIGDGMASTRQRTMFQLMTDLHMVLQNLIHMRPLPNVGRQLANLYSLLVIKYNKIMQWSDVWEGEPSVATMQRLAFGWVDVLYRNWPEAKSLFITMATPSRSHWEAWLWVCAWRDGVVPDTAMLFLLLARGSRRPIQAGPAKARILKSHLSGCANPEKGHPAHTHPR